MKRLIIPLCLFVLFVFPRASVAQTEDPSFALRLRRDFGYSSGTGRIQGRFSMIAEGRDDVVEVRFLIDDKVIGTVKEAPFKVSFSTSDYADGSHVMVAIGVLLDGGEVVSNRMERTFINAEEAWGETTNILLPLLGGIGVAVLLSAIGPLLFGRRSKQEPGVYNRFSGGAVCPRCGLPYSRSIWSPDLLAGKLERYPHCGKRAIVRRATQAELKAAEVRMAQKGSINTDGTEDETERLRRAIEASRFED
ncbi:MAG: Ig-like domain-containing protein [Chloroflexota bacterium]